MRLALCQPRPTDGDIDGAFGLMAKMAQAAALAGADMLLMPELFLPGYNRPDLHGTAAQPIHGSWVERAAGIAADSSCALTFGFAERAEGTVWNTAITLSKTGEMLAHYRKIQLYGAMEAACFDAGADLISFDFMDRRIGLLICYDIEFQDHARALAVAGADLILVPTANPISFPHVSDLVIPARAAENGITVAYANYAGDEGDVTFGGGSVIAGPDGGVLAQAGGTPALLIATLPAPTAPRPMPLTRRTSSS